MDDSRRPSGPQFHADRPAEQDAVRTTIVGGRPPGSGHPIGNVPRGIEILVKKAAVDPEFKQQLLERRADAAAAIDLAIAPAEAVMLRAVSREQLDSLIAQTHVPDEHRRAFLGWAAAAMLATLGFVPGCEPSKGVRPDEPPQRQEVKGIRPDERRPKAQSFGTQPDRPLGMGMKESSPPPPPPSPPVSRGIRPDRPPPKQ